MNRRIPNVSGLLCSLVALGVGTDVALAGPTIPAATQQQAAVAAQQAPDAQPRVLDVHLYYRPGCDPGCDDDEGGDGCC